MIPRYFPDNDGGLRKTYKGYLIVTEIGVQVPTNYQFAYHVADSYSGDVHHHTESKTDYTTKGQYSVKLPDGRTQVTTPDSPQSVSKCREKQNISVIVICQEDHYDWLSLTCPG